MRHSKFKKGDFITENSSRNGSFAVFEGEVYEPAKKGDPLEYSLMCFYNPEHYTQNSNGEYKKEYVFECDVEDDTCQYIIDENDLNFWRACTTEEKRDALKFLAEVKHIAFDESTNAFRTLKDNEKISFEPPKSTGQCGGNTQHYGSESRGLNPFYRGTVQTVSEKTNKIITRNVDKDWEQKEPISNMSYERIKFVGDMCEKLKYAFNYSAVGCCYPYGMYDEWDYYD